ncbi:MAG: heavy-metal-associated domain-containing protein [Bacteroidetes bacterium]|nr:heavy-metal-associated domain-containing protein [Bacteroidota bacterium]
MNKVNIKIEGMTCGHCQKSVNKLIAAVEGVNTCEVSLEKGEATVEFDGSKTSKNVIVKAVNDSEIYKAN